MRWFKGFHTGATCRYIDEVQIEIRDCAQGALPSGVAAASRGGGETTLRWGYGSMIFTCGA